MKKVKKSRSVRFSKNPPSDWPSEEIFTEAERQSVRKSATKKLRADTSPVDRTKHELCEKFIEYFLSEKITQRELSNRLDTTENRVSEILSFNYGTFTIDRLIELLSRIKPNLNIKIDVNKNFKTA